MIELLTQTAFIQPPADQLADGPPDIRPAFVHTFRTVAKDAKYLLVCPIDNSIPPPSLRIILNDDVEFSLNRNASRRYGVIECDHLVLKGLEKTVSKSDPFSVLLFLKQLKFSVDTWN